MTIFEAHKKMQMLDGRQTFIGIGVAAFFFAVRFQEFRESSFTGAKAVVWAYLRHHPIYQYNDLIYIRQEADSMSHQDTSLQRKRWGQNRAMCLI